MPRSVKSAKDEDLKGGFFGANVKKRRVELDISQQKMAEHFNVDRAWLSRLEKGSFPNNPDIIIEIAKYLKVSIDWLFTHGKEGP